MVDKLSLKILHFLRGKSEVPESDIVDKFGQKSVASLHYLRSNDYISSGTKILGTGPDSKPVFMPNGIYSIAPKGHYLLESKPGTDFDRWLTRIIAIVGAVTGISAIVLELWLHFL